MLKVAHGLLIATLALEALYCLFQVFVVLQPPGHAGPLLFAADDVPMELLVARRLYAIEGWLAFVGLAIYLSITEIRPRLSSAAAGPGDRPSST